MCYQRSYPVAIAIVSRPLDFGWLAVIVIKLLEEYYQADIEGNSQNAQQPRPFTSRQQKNKDFLKGPPVVLLMQHFCRPGEATFVWLTADLSVVSHFASHPHHLIATIIQQFLQPNLPLKVKCYNVFFFFLLCIMCYTVLCK